LPGRGAPSAREIYVETVRQGNAIKATAIDSLTGAEAYAVGPLAARHEVERIAVGKLQRLLGIRLAEEPQNDETPPGPGRGIIV
jgi:hypothetical protein